MAKSWWFYKKVFNTFLTSFIYTAMVEDFFQSLRNNKSATLPPIVAPIFADEKNIQQWRRI